MSKRPALLLWFLLLGALLVSVLMLDPMRSERDEEITISDFITRVETGDIVRVTITGDHVRGEIAAQRHVVARSSDNAELIRVMRARHVPFEERAEPNYMSWMMLLMKLAIPLLIIVFIMRAMKAGGGGGIGGGIQRMQGANKAMLHSDVKTSFADVAGCDEAIEEVRDLVMFLKEPHRFGKLGGRVPKGVLLIGPSGTGKTLLARAVAGEASVPFFAVSASSFVEMFVGVGAARVRDLFEQAKKKAPCIVFIDELDAIGKKRGGLSYGGHDEREQTLNELLIAMDGFAPNQGIIVIGATNRPEILDSALTRAGRFDRRVVVPKPDIRGREAILKVHARDKKLAPDVDFNVIARGTTGMTGADLEELLNEAAVQAAKQGKKEITTADIERAGEKIYMGPERKGDVLSEGEKRTVAFHESGHTIVGWMSPDADPVHKVTIVPRGLALGLTWSLPTEDKKLRSRNQLLAEIDILYGGRVAEELIHGTNVTTGASNDLERLTEVAIRMITDFGMGENGLGLRTFGEKEQGMVFDQSRRDYSEETAASIDRAVAELLKSRHQKVRALLEEHRPRLDELANALLERETLDAMDLSAILGPRPKIV